MPLRPCPDCGAQIANSATWCPNCGSTTVALRRWGCQRWMQIVVFAFLIWAVVLQISIAPRLFHGLWSDVP